MQSATLEPTLATKRDWQAVAGPLPADAAGLPDGWERIAHVGMLPQRGAEDNGAALADQLAEWAARLDAVFPLGAWREIDRQAPLTPQQDAVLRDLIASGRIPVTLLTVIKRQGEG